MPIRDATIDDLPAIVAIFNAAIPLRATAEPAPLSVESRRHWFEEHTPGHYPLWVYEVNGTVAGWLSVSQYYRQSAYDATAEISVYVSPDRQRTGIARQLMQLAIETAPKLGFRTLVGYIWAHNEASLRLFATHGFERWGLLPRIAEIDGVAYDTVIMGRHLDAAGRGA